MNISNIIIGIGEKGHNSAVYYQGRMIGRCQRAEVEAQPQQHPYVKLEIAFGEDDLGIEAARPYGEVYTLEELRKRFAFLIYYELSKGLVVEDASEKEIIAPLEYIHFTASVDGEMRMRLRFSSLDINAMSLYKERWIKYSWIVFSSSGME